MPSACIPARSRSHRGSRALLGTDLPASRTLRPWWWLAATAAIGVVSFAVGWKLHTPDSALPPWNLTPIEPLANCTPSRGPENLPVKRGEGDSDPTGRRQREAPGEARDH